MRKKIDESFQDYIPVIIGSIGTIFAIKQFGMKILGKIFNSILDSFGKNFCTKSFKFFLELIKNSPEKVIIEYKKFDDYYQISLDLQDKSFMNEDFDVNSLEPSDLPALIKIYSNGKIDFKCVYEIVSFEYGEEIYSELEGFIRKYGKENKKLRDQNELIKIREILNSVLPSVTENGLTQEKIINMLQNMDSNLLEKLSNELSQFFDISQEDIKKIIINSSNINLKFNEGLIYGVFAKELYKNILDYIEKNNLNESILPVIKEEINRIKSLFKYKI